MTRDHDVLILGAGLAGMRAALEAARGGAASTRPEYRLQLKQGGGNTMEPARMPANAKLSPSVLAALPKPSNDEIHAMPVQGNVYILIGAGGNIAASIGKDGILLVDSGKAEMATKVLQTVLQLATSVAAVSAFDRQAESHCRLGFGPSPHSIQRLCR